MPVLDKFRQYHYDATAKVSENTRTLALSAIAIVWALCRFQWKLTSQQT